VNAGELAADNRHFVPSLAVYESLHLNAALGTVEAVGQQHHIPAVQLNDPVNTERACSE